MASSSGLNQEDKLGEQQVCVVGSQHYADSAPNAENWCKLVCDRTGKWETERRSRFKGLGLQNILKG